LRAKAALPVSGIGAIAGLPIARRQGRGLTSKRIYNDGETALAVDATAMFMFSVHSGSREALIASMRCDRVPKEVGLQGRERRNQIAG
jgi:hypothetical protein